MLDPPSTPPTDIQALIIYDIYQWKTMEKSYENYQNLCDSLRIENISFGDFEYWFNRYSKEYYYSVKNGRSLPVLDISACVLSDFINGKSAEYSYNQISEALGEDVVMKEDFEKWRNSFSNGNRRLSDEESQTQKIVNVIERDPLVIRGRILEEFGKVQDVITTHPKHWRSVTLKAHKRLSETIGYDYVDYPEFEFWILRFLQGNFDWGYDRSSDPKPSSFTDLPLDVFNKICENLKLHDRLRLRDVCKDIRAQVDSWDLKVTKFWYRSANNWRVFNKCSLGLYQNPISFMMNMLKHPKFQLNKLKIRALYNCPRFTLKLGGGPAGGLKAKLIKKLMKKGKVQKCVIYAQRGIMNYFNEPKAMVPDFPSLRRYPIPGTNEFYELEYRVEFGEQFVRLQRKQ